MGGDGGPRGVVVSEEGRGRVTVKGERLVSQYGEGRPNEVEVAANLAKDFELANRMFESLMHWGLLPDPMADALPALMETYEVPSRRVEPGGGVEVLSNAQVIGLVKRAIVEKQQLVHERLGGRRRLVR